MESKKMDRKKIQTRKHIFFREFKYECKREQTNKHILFSRIKKLM